MQETLPLSGIDAGRKVCLIRINAGRELTHRLLAMGLTAGVEITVVQNSHPGPFVISVRDTRLVLGHGMASKILVAPQGPEP